MKILVWNCWFITKKCILYTFLLILFSSERKSISRKLLPERLFPDFFFFEIPNFESKFSLKRYFIRRLIQQIKEKSRIQYWASARVKVLYSTFSLISCIKRVYFLFLLLGSIMKQWSTRFDVLTQNRSFEKSSGKYQLNRENIFRKIERFGKMTFRKFDFGKISYQGWVFREIRDLFSLHCGSI